MTRRTKIVATLGPATASDEAIEELARAGVDVFRLNFSHGTHPAHEVALARVRAAAARTGRALAVLQDLSGPKIRTGRLADGKPIDLRTGDTLAIATGNEAGAAGRVFTEFAPLAASVRPGDRLLLDDGRIELRVESSDGRTMQTHVVHGGPLGEHKGINAPEVELPASSLTAKDLDDLRFGVTIGVDMIALSFVQSAADLARAREAVTAAGDASMPLVAKIERPQAVARLDEILASCDAVMVARGDLGLELPLERVPRVQKEITRRARARGLPVIVATQVLESMRTAPRPTRAEVSDAANAVDDSVDAIMLAGETAVGAYPRDAVQTLDAVIRDAEAMPPAGVAWPMQADAEGVSHGRALCEAAVTLATEGKADAIVAVTRGGRTARLLSALRPRARILAATHAPEIARRLSLWWGVTPLVIEAGADLTETGAAFEQRLRSGAFLAPGSVVVVVNVDAELTFDTANFLRLRRLGE
jgi:pyruvate kinase